MPDILLACANAEQIPLADDSVHVVVTSPPYYGLRAYKAGEGEIGLEESPELYLEHMVAVFREVRRVLRDDGVCWVNMGDSYANNPGNGRGGETPDGGIPHRSGTDKTHAGYKPLDLMNIPARLVLALQAAGWYHRSTIIWAKCLSHSTRVYAKTQKGMQPVPVGDLARLDPTTIELWTGKQWALVKSISKSLQTEGIELAFRNGQRISCTTNHRWVLRGGQITWANDLKVGDRLESATLPESHKAVDYIPDSIGWFIGMFIAEGSFGKDGKVIQISSHKDETLRFELLQEIANDYDGTCQMHRTSENGATINIYSPALIGIINQYVNGHSAKNKHLSMKCWQRSNDFLLAILTGYLEGDGHFDGQRWRLGFTRNDMWADDLRTLGARLGKSVRLKRAWHKMGDKKFYGFRGSIAEHHKRRTDDWEIIGIQKSKSRAFFDIEIEAPHVFALADGLLTHNSNPMPESVNGWRWERCRVKATAGSIPRFGDVGESRKPRQDVDYATWSDCPGCEKCAPNGGLVLRRGSWRPTTSHEYIFMMTKTDRYFADGEAVREESITGNGMPQGIAGGKRFGGTANTGGVVSRFGERVLYNNPAGRNARTVWTFSTQGWPGSHFATFPEELPRRCLKASLSERGCCPKCGAAWARVIERGYRAPAQEDVIAEMIAKGVPRQKANLYGNPSRDPKRYAADPDKTLGWLPTCTCKAGDPVPMIVLDPFCGSGTTGVVARELGHHFIGLDLSRKYLVSEAQVRLGLDKLRAYVEGRGKDGSGGLDGLPMFS